MATDLERQIKDVIYAGLNEHDVEKYVSFHADDVIVNAPDGTVMRGKEDMRTYFKNFFAAFPDVKFELVSFLSSGNLQCDEWIMTGTHKGDYMGIPATEKKVTIRGITVRNMKGGKAGPASFYYDSAHLMRQLGVLP